MLIFLSGVESINKKLIARQINAKLNKYVIDGYEVDFTMDNPFGIKDKNGDYISINDFILKGENNIETFKKMQELEEILFSQETRNHLFDKYEALDYELGFTSKPRYSYDNRDFTFVKSDISKKKILQNYKNCKQKYFVLTGSISKTFINEIKEELGEKQVIVINIIRNPSVCFLLNNKSKEYFEKNKNYIKEYDLDKLIDSFTNAYLLKDEKNVINVKFEDMIKTGLIINNVDCGLYLDYNNKNDYLTTYEYENRIKDFEGLEKDLEEFNNLLSNLEYFKRISETDKKVLSENEILKLQELKPINIFERLGYEKLTLEEIISLQS